MKRKRLFAVAAVLVTLGVVAVACRLWPSDRPVAPTTRPAKWAQPISLPGCPNLFKVSDLLYRGAQPTSEGMKALRNLGVKTIVNLRSFHSDRDKMAGLDFNYEHIYVKAWHPEDEEVVRFLRIVNDEGKQPVFVHCQHGADRTGTMCAIYRIALQGWRKEQALEEMVNGGFGFHGVWRNLVSYVDDLDVEDLRKRAGIAD